MTMTCFGARERQFWRESSKLPTAAPVCSATYDYDNDDNDDDDDDYDNDDEDNDNDSDEDSDEDLTDWQRQIPRTRGSKGRRRQGSETWESSQWLWWL